MKYFLLAICCLFFINDSYGQRKKRKAKPKKFLTIQGGFLFDGVYPDLDETFDPTKIGPNNYAGFNLYNLSLQRLKEGKMTGISLKASYFNLAPTLIVQEDFGGFNVLYFPHYGRKKLTFEATINHSFPLFGDMENGLYGGPALSLGVTRDRYISNRSNIFPQSRKFIFLGTGFQLDYYLKLTKKMLLAIGSQMTLVDFAVGNEGIDNPLLRKRQQRTGYTRARFLRPHFPFRLGLTFALGR